MFCDHLWVIGPVPTIVNKNGYTFWLGMGFKLILEFLIELIRHITKLLQVR